MLIGNCLFFFSLAKLPGHAVLHLIFHNQETADLVTFTEEIFNGKLQLLSSL